MTSTSTSDAEVLAEVAGHASEEAFSELIRRFERPALRLALHITGHSGMATEAVQAAFVRVWRKAPSFEREGSVRNWILKIVARECLSLVRSRRNRKSELPISVYLDRFPARPVCDPDAEQDELYAALRAHLLKLPANDRQAVALYYVGGLSQDEIAKELNVPQRTVSYRLRKVLVFLRSALTAAGYAAAMPLMGQDGQIATTSVPVWLWAAAIAAAFAMATYAVMTAR